MRLRDRRQCRTYSVGAGDRGRGPVRGDLDQNPHRCRCCGEQGNARKRFGQDLADVDDAVVAPAQVGTFVCDHCSLLFGIEMGEQAFGGHDVAGATVDAVGQREWVVEPHDRFGSGVRASDDGDDIAVIVADFGPRSKLTASRAQDARRRRRREDDRCPGDRFPDPRLGRVLQRAQTADGEFDHALGGRMAGPEQHGHRGSHEKQHPGDAADPCGQGESGAHGAGERGQRPRQGDGRDDRREEQHQRDDHRFTSGRFPRRASSSSSVTVFAKCIRTAAESVLVSRISRSACEVASARDCTGE